MTYRLLSVVSLSLVFVVALLAVGGSAAYTASAQMDVSPAGAVQINAPLSTTFTYQGQLKYHNAPAVGLFDFEFRLYDAATGGAQVGGVVALGDISVTNGLFMAALDFGASAFTGAARWLEIAVRPGAETTPLTVLSPRQALTAAPYALYATSTGALQGYPVTTTAPAEGQALVWSNGAWSGQSAFQQHFANVIVVAKSGGDYTSVTAALGSITTASDANRHLIKVMPGVYTETVLMKPYVDIEGAGELTTRITYPGSTGQYTGTVVGTSNAELRFLTVANTGGNVYATAIFNNAASPHLTHVTASALGSFDNYGVYNYSSSSPQMTNVTASASGGFYAFGVFNDSSSPQMMNVIGNASGANDNRGVYNGYSSTPQMTNVTASASEGYSNYGVYNYGSSPQMTNVTASASGGSLNCGVYNQSSSITVYNSTIRASGGSVSNYGIFNYAPSGTYTVTVNNSQVTGGTRTIHNNSNFTTRVGATLLDGGAVAPNGGTITCAGVYDENYAFYVSTCP